MSSQVTGYIGKIDPGSGTEYSIGSTAYGYCETEATTLAKVVDMTGFKLVVGATVFIKFKYKNSIASPTLNVNGTGAKPMVQYGTTAMSTGTSTNGWPDGAVMALTYDGTSWVRTYMYNNTYTMPSAICTTAAATAAKAASLSYYTQRQCYFVLLNRYDNTAASALTLNVNSTGALPLYINGTVSSSSNYTMPSGQYIVYFDGSNYYIRTDGKVDMNITGSADKSLSINGGTVNGDITIYRSTTTEANTPAKLIFSMKNTTTDLAYATSYIGAYYANTAGNNVIIKSGSNLIIGSGECAEAHIKGPLAGNTAENLYLESDVNVFVQSTANTLANRKGFVVTNGNILPAKADVATNNIGSIGTSATKWAEMWATTVNGKSLTYAYDGQTETITFS